MTNREELIEKYVRRELSESEKIEFDQSLNDDDQFAKDVQWASKLTAANHLQLQNSLDVFEQQPRRRWRSVRNWALITLALLMGMGIYFRENIKNYFYPNSKAPLKTENIVDKQGETLNSTTVAPIDTPSVFSPKLGDKAPKNKDLSKNQVKKKASELEKLKNLDSLNSATNQLNGSIPVADLKEDTKCLNSAITFFKGKEVSAGTVKEEWRQLLFATQPQYVSALISIRKEIADPQTIDDITRNKLHLFGGMLNASLPEGYRIEAVEWLNAVIKADYYPDYAAQFLIKAYIDLGKMEDAKNLLIQYPDVKSKLPVHIQKRL